MLVLAVTIALISIAIFGWLFLSRDTERYIHEQKSPLNFFFRWGRPVHHVFKIAIITLLMVLIFFLYKYLLKSSYNFAAISALIAGITISAGKELLDKKITKDDVLASILGIALGFFALFLFF